MLVNNIHYYHILLIMLRCAMILYVCLFAVVIYSSQSPDEVVFTYSSADWEAEINYTTTSSDPKFNRAYGWH